MGSWTTTSRMWMDAARPPEEFAGRAEFKMVLGGRFLQQDFNGVMMGQPFTGHGLTGFDTNRKQYTMVWADNVSSAFTIASGGISPDGNTITMFGQMDEPTMGEFGKHVKWVTRWAGADKMFFEAWEVQHGKDFKVFEVEYTRASRRPRLVPKKRRPRTAPLPRATGFVFSPRVQARRRRAAKTPSTASTAAPEGAGIRLMASP